MKNLIVLFDNNKISIDGSTKLTVSDNYKKRFESYGWSFQEINGHNEKQISKAIKKSLNSKKPNLISCKTIIGYGSPNKSGKASSHGSPLGDDEIAAVRKELGWESAPFDIPDDIASGWDGKEQGAADEDAWNEIFANYKAKYPELADEFKRRMKGELPIGWSDIADKAIADINAAGEKVATRKASLIALNEFASALPEMIGGSADLTGSNLTKYNGSVPISGDNAKGNYVWFGVREFGMTAICSGNRLKQLKLKVLVRRKLAC